MGRAALKRDAIIIGTGGAGVELGALLADAGFKLIGYTGPAPDRPLPAPLLGGDDTLKAIAPGPAVFIALGSPAAREKCARAILAAGHDWQGFVHPAAWVAPDVVIGRGIIIYPNSTVHAGVTLGEGTLVNSNASVGHETSVGSFCSIGPGVALGGRMTIGNRVYFGIGASTLEKLSIADDCVIGAGAAVVRDIKERGTYAGVPARKIK